MSAPFKAFGWFGHVRTILGTRWAVSCMVKPSYFGIGVEVVRWGILVFIGCVGLAICHLESLDGDEARHD